MVPHHTIQGVQVPAFFYGTAWKEDVTAELTRRALDAGFRAIDTANQRRHYVEAGVGEAVAAFLASGHPRDELFLQTKFTYRSGQDHRLPYDPGAPLPDQVQQSLQSSLTHLGVAHVDSYVLHGPKAADRLSDDDVLVWRAMESLHAAGRARLLGVSNVSLPQLQALWQSATVKPSFVQNRCFARDGWDAAVRAFCREHGLLYQGFSLLTANQRELASPAIGEIARRIGRTRAQVVFRFAIQSGMIPLTGTSSRAHMDEDLASFGFELGADDMRAVERVGR